MHFCFLLRERRPLAGDHHLHSSGWRGKVWKSLGRDGLGQMEGADLWRTWGQKSEAWYDASTYSSEGLQREWLVKFWKFIILPAWIFQIYQGMHSRIAGWWKIMPKGKMKMPKSSSLPCQACPLAIGVQNTAWPMGGQSSMMHSGEFTSKKGEASGLSSHFLGFQIWYIRKPLLILKHTSISHANNSTLWGGKRNSFWYSQWEVQFHCHWQRVNLYFSKWLTFDVLTVSVLSADRFTDSPCVLDSCYNRDNTATQQGKPGMGGRVEGLLSKREATEVKKISRCSWPRRGGRHRKVLEIPAFSSQEERGRG